jgi:two-component system response regulator FixJ
MKTDATVFVVDDDQAVRQSLSRLMESVDQKVATYASAQEFLDSYDPSRPGCLVLDIRMPGMSGLDLQDKLARDGVRIPVIIISGHGDVEKAVRAMKAGAVDFLRKPYKAKVLLERIGQALELDAKIRRHEAERAKAAALIAHLTPREREVMELLATGAPSKQIAYRLGLSRKTVDVHRAHIMMKLQIDSVVDIARLVEIYDGRLVSPSS